MSRNAASQRAHGLLRRSLITLATATVLTGLTLTTAPTATAAGHPTTTTAARAAALSPADYESRVSYWVNTQRRNHNLPRVRQHACADRTAERWNTHLATTNRFYHQSMQAVLKNCNATYAGETLGRGNITPKTLVRLWMNSPPHRAVLLSPNATKIGIGAQPDTSGRWVTTANLIRL